MVDVIHSPLSPSDALAALEHYARDSRGAVLPAALRSRGVVGLTLTSSPNRFRVCLHCARRRTIECVGHVAATPAGSALTYDIVEHSSRRLGIVIWGGIWLAMLLYLRLPLRQTLSLFTFAAIMLAVSAFGLRTTATSAFRVGVYDMFSSALEGSDLQAATYGR